MFETENLIIRGGHESDIEVILQSINQVDYVRNMSSLYLGPIDKATIQDAWKPHAPHELPRLAVCLKPDDWAARRIDVEGTCKPPRMIGALSFLNRDFDIKNRGCNLGLGFYDPSHRGKGYGRELLNWALDYGFYELGLHRIGLVVYSFNEPAIALYRKIGFVEEGRIRESNYSQGKWYDTLMFGLLEPDWAKIKAKKIENSSWV